MKTLDFDFDNIGGISAVYAIPVTSLLRIRHDRVTGKYHPEFTNRDAIVRIPIYADDTYQFEEQQSHDDGGELYAVSLSGVIPKMSDVNAAVIRVLENGEWYVLHQDRNGCVILSGSSSVPLRFLSARSTGKSVEELNGNSFTFSASEPDASLIVEIDDINDL
jgi:hypothetical protein